ncbi:uncharacterized protein LOC128223945 [Mya arenaria]|uniref:uncharacterized protein LOC128205622 n=1 Tax=Mya arenaria TaxID=6604 RepID=UPI0022E82B30|nr:uncharacterized protein LOC128205622 [Mya arenaria]XP_052764794.1 uncharacterized protein LOC128206420 [Mya arenaria]XP_052786750.1 uncharacterized protein LOC128222037 [Mya arenaria]XP_052789417.1 uncharacterized protein LOC128223945 [Mya arenaria]
MSFHPEKCSILRVHRKRSPTVHDYKLKGHTLETEDCTKYLGLNICTNLSWDTHISKIAKKGNSTLGFLRRNLRISSEETKARAYNALVRPQLEYCSTVWNPYTKTHIRRLEMVQRRAARYVTKRYHNTSSVTSMLEDLGWETLESRRTKAQLTMMYKIVNNLVDIQADSYLTPSNRSTRTSNNRNFTQISTSTSYYKFSFFPRTITEWNKLPSSIVEAPDLVSFKQGLSTVFS